MKGSFAKAFIVSVKCHACEEGTLIFALPYSKVRSFRRRLSVCCITLSRYCFAACLYTVPLNELPCSILRCPCTVKDGFVHLLGLLFPSHALLQKRVLFWGKSPVTESIKGTQ